MSKITSKVKLKILFQSIIEAVIIVCIIIYIFYNIGPNELSDIRYSIKNEETVQKIEAKEIIKEKGKEEKYYIKILKDKIELPKAIYNEYIGDENNAITIKKSTVTIYIGKTLRNCLMLDTNFSGNLKTISKCKVSYPWEKDEDYYTEKDAEKLAISYIKGELKYYNILNIFSNETKEEENMNILRKKKSPELELKPFSSEYKRKFIEYIKR